MHIEPFSPEETASSGSHFTNADKSLFGLTNLPEVVKGALFARYSRTGKSLRRLFLDEFFVDGETEKTTASTGLRGRKTCTAGSSTNMATTLSPSLLASTWQSRPPSNILTKCSSAAA